MSVSDLNFRARKIWGIEVRVFATVMALLLSLLVSDQFSRAGTHLLPSADDLGATIVSHFQAVERNSHSGAMSHFHSQAPGRTDIAHELELAMSDYLQTVGRFTFSNFGIQDNYAEIRATHEYLIITGLKFISKTVVTTYQFKEEDGLWKIWSKQKL